MSPASSTFRSIAALAIGMVVCQALLYGPSMLGRKILAPTDLLVLSGVIGRDPQHAGELAQNSLLLDPVEVFYPSLAFAAREVWAGRLPLWNPYIYCGSPFLASNQSAVFSPFTVPFYLWPDPRMFVWIHLLKVLVAGLGTFLFLRQMGITHWSSLVGGLCFAHVGYFIAWLSFPLSSCAVWLPWGFFAAESVVRRPKGWGGPGLAVVVAALLLSGHLESAAQVLVAIAFYGVWRWLETVRGERWSTRIRIVLVTGTVAGVVGLGIAAFQILPTSEYLESSLRMLQRQEGWADDIAVDRRAELLRLGFPYLLGTMQRGSHIVVPPTFNESSVNGYVGFTLLGLLAPLGVVSRWRHPTTWCWVVVGVVAAAPMFRIPVVEWWSRLPPFDLMRNNRMLLITGWSALVLGVRGIDSLADRLRGQRLVGAVGFVAAAVAAAGFAYILLEQPRNVMARMTVGAWPWFRGHLFEYAIITFLGMWLMLVWLLFRGSGPMVRVCFGLLALIELLVAERGYNPQVDRATFYPEREFIKVIAGQVDSGRVCGLRGILTPNIGMMYGLRDVRGYDAVDPLPYLELLRVANYAWKPARTYAVTRTFWSSPSPVLDMLAVRYIIAPRPMETTWESVSQANGLWIYRNPSALPRAFIPRRAIVVEQSDERLTLLGNPAFDPRDTVLISSGVELPPGEASGTVRMIEDEPCRVVLEVNAATEAIVVLADSWAPGWTVRVGGRPTQPLQANHALRAVPVPAGRHLVEWQYAPASVRLGFRCAFVSLTALLAWCAVLIIGRSINAGHNHLSNSPQAADARS